MTEPVKLPDECCFKCSGYDLVNGQCIRNPPQVIPLRMFEERTNGGHGFLVTEWISVFPPMRPEGRCVDGFKLRDDQAPIKFVADEKYT